MPRVTHVLKARKAMPDRGIQVGDSYYWWKFRHGGKHVSKTPPRRSQLTQSSFLSQMYDLEDRIADLAADSSLPDEIAQIAQALRDLAEECESSKSNMPDALQESDTGQLLDTRAEGCNSAADELEAIETDYTPEEPDEDAEEDDEEDDAETAEQDHWNGVLDEVQQVTISYE